MLLACGLALASQAQEKPLRFAGEVKAGQEFRKTIGHGLLFVLKADDKFEVVAKNMLKEGCYASPALSDGQIFIRGAKHLYCVGRKN